MKSSFKVSISAFIVGFTLCILSASIGVTDVGIFFGVNGMLMFLISIVALIVGIVQYAKETPAERAVRKTERADKKVKAQAVLAERRAAIDKYREETRKSETIVEVKILGVGNTPQKRSGLGGAIIGGLVAGPLGAVVGAGIPKNGEQKVWFAIKYADGRIKMKEALPNSSEYKKLIEYVKWGDLKGLY